MRMNLPVTGREYKLKPNDFLISRTDKTGRITYANHSFIEVSGYSRDELLGQPHNILRHPDMPSAAFADLWEVIKSGQTWAGMVKNRRKNGDHYWVYAHVAPILENGQIQGYVSMRTKAADETIEATEEVYRQIREDDSDRWYVSRGKAYRRGLLGWLRRLDLWSLRGRMGFWFLLPLLLLLASTLVGFKGLAGQEEVGSLATVHILLMLGGAVLMGSIWWRASRAIARPLDKAMEFTLQIAAGNLVATPPEESRGDEMGRLLVALDVMRKSLNCIVGYIHQGVGAVEPEAHGIAVGNENLSVRTEQQAGFLQNTASSMEEIMATSEQNASHARNASELVSSTNATVKESGELMRAMVDTMGRISQSSGRIATIVDVIDSIAFQTNILALNASVEAARAGESGRGFAVVAGEVRSLASRSAEAAREIRKLIEESSGEVADGTQLMQKAEEAIDEVVSAVTRVNTLMGDIAVATGEQSIGIATVNEALVEMDVVTQKNALLVQSTAEASAVLDHQTRELAYAMKVFRMTGGIERGRDVAARVQSAKSAGETAARRNSGAVA